MGRAHSDLSPKSSGNVFVTGPSGQSFSSDRREARRIAQTLVRQRIASDTVSTRHLHRSAATDAASDAMRFPSAGRIEPAQDSSRIR